MTVITNFNHNPGKLDPLSQLLWEQTKVIVDELNRREAERMETVQRIKDAVGDQYGFGPEEVPDMAGIAAAIGAVAGLIQCSPSTPRAMIETLELIVMTICPDAETASMCLTVLAASLRGRKDFKPQEGEVELMVNRIETALQKAAGVETEVANLMESIRTRKDS